MKSDIVATPQEMYAIRMQSSLEAANLSQKQAHAQMRRNGSIPTPNPWYKSPKKK